MRTHRRDPMYGLMDRQLRCRVGDQLGLMSNTADWPGPRITVTLNGKKTRHVVDIASPHEQSVENPEDAFIEALDIKYKWVFRRDYRILDYLRMGYTQKEAGSLVGVSGRQVRRIIKKLAS